MNWDQVEGNWHQLKGQVKAKWGKFTDDDLKTISGKREQLVGKLQEHYGVVKEDAEKQLDTWLSNAKVETAQKDIKRM